MHFGQNLRKFLIFASQPPVRLFKPQHTKVDAAQQELEILAGIISTVLLPSPAFFNSSVTYRN